MWCARELRWGIRSGRDNLIGHGFSRIFADKPKDLGNPELGRRATHGFSKVYPYKPVAENPWRQKMRQHLHDAAF